MKYYKVAPAFNNANKRVASSASGDKVLKGEEYYNILKDGEFHKEIPLLKHFFLESYDEKKYWDFQLNDIHNLIGKANTIIGYYLSNDFKNILEDFNIAPVFNFYETLLLYKEKELKYWLFQYGVNSFDNFNLPQSSWFSSANNFTSGGALTIAGALSSAGISSSRITLPISPSK